MLPTPPGRKVVGLIGHPLRHSVSPVFQQAAFDFYEIAAEYQAWETPPDRIADVAARVRLPDCLGMNVTVPHKESILVLLDEVEERARTIGAVNTVVNRGGELVGYNTDWDGCLRALREAGYSPEGARVLLLGAGGAARAAAFGLLWAGVREVAVANRHRARADVLVADVLQRVDGRILAVDWDEATLAREAAASDLIVNATPVGMLHGPAPLDTPLPPEAIPRGALLYDLVYNPPATPLLRAATAVGARTLEGLPMLVYQGAAAFELWTGRRAPIGLMLERARGALRGGG